MDLTKYYNLINSIINHMHNDTIELVPFDDIYTQNYMLSVKNYPDIVNIAYDMIKYELVHFDKTKQKLYFDMIGDIFMYPIMMNIIENHICLFCDNETKHNELYCKYHKSKPSYLDDIKTFKNFKNEYCYGGKLWMDHFC